MMDLVFKFFVNSFKLTMVFIPLVFFQRVHCRVLSNDYFEAKKAIEQSLTQNLVEVIQTKLKKKTFNASVSVKLGKIKKNKKNIRSPNSEELLSDLRLGVFDIAKIVESYEKKINEIEDEKKQSFNEKYFLVEAKISVGLDPSYGEEYSLQFSTWLKKYVSENISPKAKSHVELIDSPKESVPEKIDPSQVKPIYDQLRDFQFLLGSLLVLLTFLFIAFLFRFKKPQNEMVNSPQMPAPPVYESQSQGVEESPSEKENSDPKSQENEEEESDWQQANIIKEVDEYSKKIITLCLKLGKSIEPIVTKWSHQGLENQLKILVLFDALISLQEGGAKLHDLEKSKIQEVETILAKVSEPIKEIFEDASELSLSEKLEVSKSTYWGLASLQLLGKEQFKIPFSELQEFNFSEVKNIMESQDIKTQSIVMLHLDENKRKEYLENLDYKHKKNLIRTAIDHSTLEVTEMEDIQTSIKVLSKTIQKSDRREHLNLFPKTSKVLKSLKPSEEIKMLREIRSDSSKSTEIIKSYYSTIAFIDDWEERFVKKILENISSEELTEFLRFTPDIKDNILSHCPERIRIIVEDELRLDSITSEEKKNSLFQSLQKKVNRLLNDENIVVGDLYVNEKSQEQVYAA